MLLATARMSNSDACDGFHASQTPSANQIPVLNSSGRLVLDGTDDGSSKIQTNGNIKAGSNILMGGELIGPSSLKVHPNTSDGVDSGVSYVCGGGWPQPSRGGFLEVRGNESASFPGDVKIISGGPGNVSLWTGGGYERLKIVPAGRCILSGDTNTASLVDDGVNALQVNGTIASKGIKLDGTASADVNTLDYYKEGTFTPVIYGETTAGTGTYTTQLGKYTRLGNVVFYNVDVYWTAHTGTGLMRISGLPYNSAVTSAATCYYDNFTVGSGKELVASLVAGTSEFYLRAADPAGGGTVTIPMDTSGVIRLTGHYFV